MKNLIAIVFAVSSVSAFADQVIVTKSNHTGFTAPQYARNETCTVYTDRVVVTKYLGRDANGVKLEETTPIELSGNIEGLLAAAADEKVEQKDNGLCDGPSTLIAAGNVEHAAVLFATGGCGNKGSERVGPASRILVELVDRYCPTTYKMGLRAN